MSITKTDELFLFMVLLGSKAPDRNVEQHDYFFGIANNLKDLVPASELSGRKPATACILTDGVK